MYNTNLCLISGEGGRRRDGTTNMKLKRSHWRNSWNTPAVISRHVPRLYILVSVFVSLGTVDGRERTTTRQHFITPD